MAAYKAGTLSPILSFSFSLSFLFWDHTWLSSENRMMPGIEPFTRQVHYSLASNILGTFISSSMFAMLNHSLLTSGVSFARSVMSYIDFVQVSSFLLLLSRFYLCLRLLPFSLPFILVLFSWICIHTVFRTGHILSCKLFNQFLVQSSSCLPQGCLYLGSVSFEIIAEVSNVSSVLPLSFYTLC